MFTDIFDKELMRIQMGLTSIVGKIDFDDPISLVKNSENAEVRREVIRRAKESRQVKSGNKLFLMPPLYISSGDPMHGGCADHCCYCPWRHGNLPKGKVVRLSPKETLTETVHLLSKGYGDIELVAATDPLLLNSQEVAKYVKSAREAGAKNIGINFQPFKTFEDYQVLTEAGCTFSIVWQETYLPDVYQTVHPRGIKADMSYRLNAQDRACQGGVKTVGLAFLGGIADWKVECLMVLSHAKYLHNKYGVNVIFGMPRWKGGGDGSVTATEYTDEQYRFVGALYSLFMPDSLVWFSTREDFGLSAKCVTGGACIFTLDCSTEVGYKNRHGGGQFPVHSMDIERGIPWLEELGFNPQIHLPW